MKNSPNKQNMAPTKLTASNARPTGTYDTVSAERVDSIKQGYVKISAHGLRTHYGLPSLEYVIQDHILDDIVRDAGSQTRVDIPESRSVNLRELAIKHDIDFDKLYSAFIKAMDFTGIIDPPADEPSHASVPEHSGFDVNYYSVRIEHPKRPDREPYTFEVEDLIQALGLGFHEGTILKSLIRSATARELGLLKQGGDYIRDAEKMVHSSQEELRARKLRAAKS